jgi:hypothetical protein
MKTFQIENEFEYQRIISTLVELGIDYTEKINHDSSFPVLDNLHYFAEITVEDEFAELLRIDQ